MAGVTIQVKGGPAKTVSQNDGTFSINAPSSSAVLLFSYVGFTEQQVAVKIRQQLTICRVEAATKVILIANQYW